MNALTTGQLAAHYGRLAELEYSARLADAQEQFEREPRLLDLRAYGCELLAERTGVEHWRCDGVRILLGVDASGRWDWALCLPTGGLVLRAASTRDAAAQAAIAAVRCA